MLFAVTIALSCAIAFAADIPDGSEFQLPEGIPTCFQDDPNLNDCIKKAIQDMTPSLHKGNKVLGIPPLDPLTFPNSRYDYNNGGIQGSLAIKGVKIYGISRAEIRMVDVKITENGITSDIEVFFPRLFIEGRYKGDIKINDIKMNPKGYLNITMTNVRVLNKMAGIFETNNGERHLRLNSYDIIPDIGDMKVYASGLLPDPQLNSIVLDFINQYWPEVYRLILPETRVHWQPILIEAANQFLLTVPVDKILKIRE